ncbi:cystine transport system substrate-binding protein [Herbaspirillum sp. Sphag1AN]|uniref:cystine ABC transporter substrate-binding protein n=1 Tax=unclassified Herbaspirillum TaxID=2624150 RepID=UPI00161E4CEC|nr:MULTISPECIES: cystine ABC transporter substrate-binding protein [unclassified Herbaspirillum]MBB3211910.1 cystine transport system substrate-binding protein [Herbaspirillum sp. Sphag1AN]MBB3244256.1 cystine transport system substrate-binding protein [Herbaspirillum sp. Sphag64]
MTSKKNRTVASFLAVFLLAGASVAAHATDLLDTVKARGTLKVALEGTYPPFNFKDPKTGELSGFEVEVAKLLAAKLGLKPEFTTTEWSGILAGLGAGKYDVIINQVGITDERQKAFDFSDPYTLSSAQLIVRKDEKRQFNSLEDLKGKKLGLGQGTNFEQKAKSVAGIDVRTYPGAPEYLADLASGRLDAALNDSLLVGYLLKSSNLPLKGGAPVGSIDKIGIPFQKGNPEFKAALNKALADIKKDGSFKQISVKWFGIDVSQPPAAQ